jgi:hypothetical protein
MKRRTNSDILIPVRFASFLSLTIWESERNMEMRFMPCIYVEHIFLSSVKCTRAENNSADLESVLLASRRVNAQHTFQRSSAHFTGIVRSRFHRKESRHCARKVAERSGTAELSGPDQQHNEGAFQPARATLFFLRARCASMLSPTLRKPRGGPFLKGKMRAGQKRLKLLPLKVAESTFATSVNSVTIASLRYVFIRAHAPWTHCFFLSE